MNNFKHKNIYNTKHFIDSNYNKLISIKDLENISFCSYRNLQRIFFSLFNETIGAYKTRLKIENGYKLLLYSKMQLTDIALEIGFSDIQSFSKAFKNNFGFAPSEALNNKEILFKEHNIVLSINQKLIPEIIDIPVKLVYYKNYRTNYINPEIEVFWGDFMVNLNTDLPFEYFGLIKDDLVITNKVKCTYETCILADEYDLKLPKKEILGSKYAKFTHKGTYESLENTYSQIYGGWILENQLEFSFLPIIEHYLKHEANTDDENDFVTDILIPLL